MPGAPKEEATNENERRCRSCRWIRDAGLCRQRVLSLVQDSITKKCSIVEAKPTVSTTAVVGAAHTTQAEAEIAMKADKSCGL